MPAVTDRASVSRMQLLGTRCKAPSGLSPSYATFFGSMLQSTQQQSCQTH